MSEPTPEMIAMELYEKLSIQLGTSTDEPGELKLIADAIRAAEQRGWETCREACKAEALKQTWEKYGYSWPRIAEEIADAIAALTPPKE